MTEDICVQNDALAADFFQNNKYSIRPMQKTSKSDEEHWLSTPQMTEDISVQNVALAADFFWNTQYSIIPVTKKTKSNTHLLLFLRVSEHTCSALPHEFV